MTVKRKMKTVLIDARLAGLENAGIGRYVQSLCERLEFSSRRGEGGEGLEGLDGRREAINILSVRSGPKHYSLMEQLRFPSILKNLQPDLAHFPHFNVPLLYNEPFVVTIHDLLWHERVGFSATTLPKWLYLIKYIGYRAVLRHAILRSEAIIVPSKWVKGKIVERFPEAEGKIKVIYEGVAKVFSSTGDKDYNNYKDYNFPYLIYIGSLYPHKNVAVILNVLKYFDDLKLVVVCARSVFRQRFEAEIEKRGLRGKVIFAGFVPDEELAVLYRKAAAFVFPSLSEGFGLPGLEAMAAGCPVISSNAGALPEIYGGAAVYFDPKNEAELTEKIREIREDRGYRKNMIELGKERVKIFTWERCAKETLEVYQRVLKKL